MTCLAGSPIAADRGLVVAERLTRTFGTRVAVRDLSLTVASGAILTLLGPNGAGKTTTLRMLAGLILPNSGRIVINGTDVSADTADLARRSIGLLTETPGLWERLSVRLNLLTHARLHGVADAERAVSEALSLVDLTDRAADVAGKLSKGLKQRVAIARALLHKPAVLLLDEPTSGLDPASARHVRDLVGRLRHEGRAILVCTHNLSEAEELSDRIAILNTELLASDTPANLRRQLTGVKVTIEVEGDASRWLALLPPGVRPNADASGALLTLHLQSRSGIPEIVSALVSAGARIVRIVPGERSLEDVYLALVGAN